jgi:serine/threonine protein kinase
MICGIPPFYLQDLNKMYFLIKNEKNIKFDKKFLVSKDARDVITKLLEKNVEDRLCSHFGIEELKNHPFFKSIDFDALLRKEIEAPFLPRINDKTDVQNFDEVFTNEKLEMSNIASRNLSLVKENQYKFNKFIN